MYAMIGRVVVYGAAVASVGYLIAILWAAGQMLLAGGPFRAGLGGG